MVSRVYLYGPPASGKTTLAKSLSAALGCESCDLDSEIVAASGSSIAEIFAAEGEASFRRRESAALRKVFSSDVAVVSLGGGTLLDPENRRLCEESGVVICLEAPSAEEIARRIKSQAGERPLGDRAVERAAHYASFPNRLSNFFELEGSLVLVGESIAPGFLAGERLVADESIARLHPELSPIAIQPSGEENKNLGSLAALWSAFAKADVGRRDRIAALGGGVTCDLAGFAAATWMRGISWINFPTTLLSMVDASIGGKTGCDLPEGKNLAGAFHPPRLVVVDTDFLKTLPTDLVTDGKAEMIKHSIIACISSKIAPLPTAREISENLAVKAAIVRQDPFERLGIRQKLNCGHTIGHAVEKASGYRLSHGRSVAIGCVEEARLAVSLGLAPASWPEELASAFAAAGLPTAYPEGMSFASLKVQMRMDKKKLSNGAVTFALPCGWGDVRLTKVALS